MRLKFCTLASSLVAAALSIATAHGQQPPSPDQPKVGWVRFWNMLPKGAPSLELVKAGSPPGEGMLAGGAVPTGYSSYRDVPPVKQRVAVFRAGDRTTPLGIFDLPLQANGFVTVLVHGDVRRPKIEMTDDTAVPGEAPGALRVWNFYPDTAVTVSVGQQSTGSIPYDGYAAISGLPRSTVTAKVEAKLPNNTPVQAELEIGLGRGTQRATILVIPDSYGRFRPRVALDGAN